MSKLSQLLDKHFYIHPLQEENISRIKVSKTASASEKKKSKEWPAVVYYWTIGLTFFSYIIARFVPDAYTQPNHSDKDISDRAVRVGFGWIRFR